MEQVIDTVSAWQLETDDITDFGIVTTVDNDTYAEKTIVYFAEDEDGTAFPYDALFDIYGVVYSEVV